MENESSGTAGGIGRKVTLLIILFITIVTYPLVKFYDIGDDFFKFMVVVASFLLIAGFRLTKPGSSLVWTGTKTFTFRMVQHGDDWRVDKIRDFLTRPGMEYSITEVPYDTAVQLVEDDIKKQKTDLYDRMSEGRGVSEEMRNKQEETQNLLESINNGVGKLLEVNVNIDSRRVDKETAMKVVGKVKELTES